MKAKANAERAARIGEFTDNRLQSYTRWQEALATLGQIALSAGGLDQLFWQAVARLAQTLQVDYVAMLELNADGKTLTIRAGHGWRKGTEAIAQLKASQTTQLGFTLLANEPVVLMDPQSDRRFEQVPLLVKHGITSGLTVAIGGHPRPWGVMAVYTRKHREFPPDQVQFVRTVANIIASAVRSHEADQAQRDGAARVRAIVSTLVDGVITIDHTGIIESANAAVERIFGYLTAELVGNNVSMLMPQPYQRDHDQYIRHYLNTGEQRIIGIGREVVGKRKDGSTFPMDLAVSELRVSGRRMFTGVVRDVSERRRMEREILEAGDDEQRRIGQDLHDGLCQHLAGISFATEVLRQKLAARDLPEAQGISKLGKMVDDAITQARDLARGLQPVVLDSNGLAAALKLLAEKIESMFHVSCLFVSDGPCPVDDNNVATNLYRIAQEAISNAVKHGRAKTIVIDLSVADDDLLLSIKDDGVGLPSNAGSGPGMGLRTMDYRARVIGGSLQVRTRRGRGTTIICQIRPQPKMPKPPLVKQQKLSSKEERFDHAQESSDRAGKDKNPRRRRPSDRP